MWVHLVYRPSTKLCIGLALAVGLGGCKDGMEPLAPGQDQGPNASSVPQAPGPGPGSVPPPGYTLRRIAFVSERDGNREIYLVFISTRDPITNPSRSEVDSAEVWTMSASGSNQTRLTADNAWDFTPSWSPDGDRIVYRKFVWAEGSRIVVINADGMGALMVEAATDGDVDPVWSPDGARIGFSSRIDDAVQSYEIFTVTLPDTAIDLSNLKLDQLGDFKPVWSANGKWLAFESTRDGNSEVYVMRPNGAGQTNLTQNPAVDNQAAWRP